MGPGHVGAKVVKWYADHRRNLPWRQTSDPYRIWLSEIILQQTRVEQGAPYYTRFVEHFPTVAHLARAREQQVLRLWQGLGYYSRARNLHRCAKIILRRYQGQLPRSAAELGELPGIGPYTAAAIASIAFHEPVPALDGNVYRVLSRMFGIDVLPVTAPARSLYEAHARSLLVASDPGTFNQAMMELGARVCTPRQPACPSCPVHTACVAFRHDLQEVLPVRKEKKKARHRYFYYLVTHNDRGIVMRRRQADDIWQGLHDFPMIESTRPLSASRALQKMRSARLINNKGTPMITRVYRHALSHQLILARFIILPRNETPVPATPGARLYRRKRVRELPKPILIDRFLAEHELF